MHHLKISAQAAAGTAGGDRVRDLAEAGPEHFRGTAARLDWVATRQGHRDLLLQDSKVPADRVKTFKFHCCLIRDCFEDELVPVFASVGKIYELRLMIEFSGTNRTYCYVRYQFTRHCYIPGSESKPFKAY